MKLKKYLAQLNCADTQSSIYVNPENPEEYKIMQHCFSSNDNSNWVNIGTLDRLSFGFQSRIDAITTFLDSFTNSDKETATINYQDKKVKVSIKGLLEAYSQGNLDKEFSEFLDEEAQTIEEIWSEWDADNFVDNVLPEILEEVNYEY